MRGPIGREREVHRIVCRGTTIFRRYQADVGLLLATSVQQRRHPNHVSFPLRVFDLPEGVAVTVSSLNLLVTWYEIQ